MRTKDRVRSREVADLSRMGLGDGVSPQKKQKAVESAETQPPDFFQAITAGGGLASFRS
jgi:hypothetical protein